MLRTLAVLLVVSTGTTAARAERAAVIEHVETFGGLPLEAARAHLGEVLGASRHRVLEDSVPACAGDRACLRRYLQQAGGDVAVRATYVDVAGEISLAVLLIDRDGRTWEITASAVHLDTVSSELAAALTEPERALRPHAPGAGRRRTAWALAGGGALLVGGGAVMMWEARSQRDEFFDRFVDADGNVMGLSPAEAQARENRANRWLGAGLATATIGLAAAAGAAILFVTGPERSGATVAVRGVF